MVLKTKFLRLKVKLFYSLSQIEYLGMQNQHKKTSIIFLCFSFQLFYSFKNEVFKSRTDSSGALLKTFIFNLFLFVKTNFLRTGIYWIWNI